MVLSHKTISLPRRFRRQPQPLWRRNQAAQTQQQQQQTRRKQNLPDRCHPKCPRGPPRERNGWSACRPRNSSNSNNSNNKIGRTNHKNRIIFIDKQQNATNKQTTRIEYHLKTDGRTTKQTARTRTTLESAMLPRARMRTRATRESAMPAPRSSFDSIRFDSIHLVLTVSYWIRFLCKTQLHDCRTNTYGTRTIRFEHARTHAPVSYWYEYLASSHRNNPSEIGRKLQATAVGITRTGSTT